MCVNPNGKQAKLNMKKIIFLLSALSLTSAVSAQTEVTNGVMRGKDYGVTYMLPQTEIILELEISKHCYTPGKFCKYADRFLRLDDVKAEAETYYTLNKISAKTVGTPHKEKVYFVKLKDKSIAPLMELTEDGIVRSINMPISQAKQPVAPVKESAATPLPDPHSFLTEEILMASSSVKMAELIAKEIYSIRESKNALLRGEAENMPKDGAQLKLMLDNLNLQETAMTEMFSGHETSTTQILTVRVRPEVMSERVVFRFSKKLGLLDKDNLAGEPYYLSIQNLETPDINAATATGKKELEGVAYNVPGRADIQLKKGNKEILREEISVTQFGCTEYLAPVLFNKKSTTKVLFDVNTGGLIKVERE